MRNVENRTKGAELRQRMEDSSPGGERKAYGSATDERLRPMTSLPSAQASYAVSARCSPVWKLSAVWLSCSLRCDSWIPNLVMSKLWLFCGFLFCGPSLFVDWESPSVLSSQFRDSPLFLGLPRSLLVISALSSTGRGPFRAPFFWDRWGFLSSGRCVHIFGA